MIELHQKRDYLSLASGGIIVMYTRQNPCVNSVGSCALSQVLIDNNNKPA